MKLSLDRIATVARRDYLYTVRRRAFLFTLIGTPLLYALLLFVVIKPQAAERVGAIKALTTLGVVDSSGLFEAAPHEIQTEVLQVNPFSPQAATTAPQRFRTEVRFYPDFTAAEAALQSGEASQLVVIPPDFGTTGVMRRYAIKTSLFAETDSRAVSRWVVRGLLAGRVDSQLIERAAQPMRKVDLYTRGPKGDFELKNDARETLDFLLPFALGMLLGLAIVIGGQYLLQGVNEEKESRILESLLCSVSAEEFLAGKLLGLGAAGLTLVVGWILIAGTAAAPTLAMVRIGLGPGVIAVMIAYFVLGYLFFGSLMTGIGAIASNMREAQQFSVWFTFLTFIPFYLLPTLIGHPGSALAVALSLFPPTAPVSSMLRLAAPGSSVPAWQVAASLAVLAGSAALILLASARVFRVGMLMYGKTPNLPEIVRWLRQP